MRRLKFKKPVQATDLQLQIITLLERTNDSCGISYATLKALYGVQPRTVRTIVEMYNNKKFINVVRKGKLHNKNGLWKLITYNSKFALYYNLKSEINFICSCIDKANTRQIFGDLPLKGGVQMQFNIDELITYHNELVYKLELMEVEDENKQ